MNKTELQRIEEIFSFCERKTIPFCFILHLVYIASNVRAVKNEQNRTSLYGWIPEWPKGADCKSVAIASKVRILLRPFFIAAE